MDVTGIQKKLAMTDRMLCKEKEHPDPRGRHPGWETSRDMTTSAPGALMYSGNTPHDGGRGGVSMVRLFGSISRVLVHF